MGFLVVEGLLRGSGLPLKCRWGCCGVVWGWVLGFQIGFFEGFWVNFEAILV